MNENLKNTLDFIRYLGAKSKINTNRSKSDFIADRIVQAGSHPSLLMAIEALWKQLDAETEEKMSKSFQNAVISCSHSDADGILSWLRNYPKVAGMLAMLPKDDYLMAISDIHIPNIIENQGKALPSKKHDICLKITCLSPLAHGSDQKAGNATIYRRMQVLSDTGATLELPFYAGNALRGQMRDLLADDLIAALGIKPSKVNPPVNGWFFHALYAGGSLESTNNAAKALINAELGGNGTVKAQGTMLFRNMLPVLSLLGCALGNRIIPGRVFVSNLRPACKQWGNGDVDVSQLFEWMFLTRREDHENYEENHSMIANTECLRAGAVLYGGIDTVSYITDIERAALGHGLNLLAKNGYIGAENRRGLGQVKIEIENCPDPQPYQQFLQENKTEITECLINMGAINHDDEGRKN